MFLRDNKEEEEISGGVLVRRYFHRWFGLFVRFDDKKRDLFLTFDDDL